VVILKMLTARFVTSSDINIILAMIDL